MQNFWDTVVAFAEQTPWWVYLLFAYLLFIGIQAFKDDIKPIYVSLIMPTVFTGLSIESIIKLQHLDPLYSAGIYAGCLLLIGGTIGFLLARRFGVKVDNKNKLIELPGNAFTLVSILLIFSTKYYFSYRLAVASNDVSLDYHFIAVSGVITGLFVGRTAFYWLRMLKGPWTDLSDKTN